MSVFPVQQLAALLAAALTQAATMLRSFADTLDELREAAEDDPIREEDARNQLVIVRDDLDAVDALGWKAA
jgi:chaperonin cofactor prefoldin